MPSVATKVDVLLGEIMRVRRILSLMKGPLLVVLLTACQPEASTEPPSNSATAAGDSPPPQKEILESSLVQRFSLSLNIVDGGSSIVISGRTSSHRKSADVRITIDAPDLYLLAHSVSADSANSIISRSHQPTLSRRLQMAPSAQDDASVPIPRPVDGYYQITLSATVDSTETSLGVPIQSFASLTRWMFVTKSGVVVTDDFDPTLFGDSLVVQPGPLRQFRRRRSSVTAGKANAATAAMNLQSTVSSQLVRLTYWNLETSSFVPVVGATIRFTQYDTDTYGTTFIGSVASDTNGTFAVPCPIFSDRYVNTWSARPENIDVVVSGPQVEIGGGATDFNECVSETIEVHSTQDEMAHLFSNFRSVIPLTRSFFGHTRPVIGVNLSSTAAISRYVTGDDRITIARNGGNAAVWDSYGRFTAAHEYGHALHETAFGGIHRFLDCPSTHYFGLYSNLGCAWVEGFASFVAWAVWTPQIDDPRWAPAAGTNPWRNSALPGTVAEADVASLLYDVVDHESSPSDSVAVAGSYLMALIKECRKSGIFSSRVDGADHLAACLERGTIDNATQDTYLVPIRGMRLSGIDPNVPNSVGIVATQARRLWLWKFFSVN